ncbi:MAG: radical SAM protein [Humidesulfovibrio sp.]|nr:radical SAM protein [Humidesulfovibrio sp.]
MDRFAHPAPPRTQRARILSVFLPFAGCPQRCLFCNQPAQTGAAPEPLEAVYARLTALLNDTGQEAPQELAFYGGTFTALPAPWPRRFLELAGPHLASGRLTRLRCSTRPDALSAPLLAELKSLGLSLVELGVQSFNDAALAACQRGYGGAAAHQACELVRAMGLDLGVQLMPGLPGQTVAAFREDIARTVALGPQLTRLYPCLVLADTRLAELWRDGAYVPWPLDATVDELARALLALWTGGIPTARIGLAEQEGLEILAGPRHPALGQLARSRALFLFIRQRLRQLPAPPFLLLAPRRLQGEILGQKNALAGDYAALGLEVRLWDEPDLALYARD